MYETQYNITKMTRSGHKVVFINANNNLNILDLKQLTTKTYSDQFIDVVGLDASNDFIVVAQQK